MNFAEHWPKLVIGLLAIIAYRLYKIQDTLSGGPERRAKERAEKSEERRRSWEELKSGWKYGVRPSLKIAGIIAAIIIALPFVFVLACFVIDFVTGKFWK